MKDKIYIEPAASERKYRRLAALGKELGVPVPQVFLEMEVKLPDGTVVHHHKQRSHSWVRNAYNLLFCQLAAVNLPDNTYAAGKLSLRRPSGTVAPVAEWNTSVGTPGFAIPSNLTVAGGGYLGVAGTATVGILVGSGLDAESFNDYVLQTLIANGNGAGQLDYALSNAYVVNWVLGTLTLSNTLVRYMNNNSAGDVAVNEVGLYIFLKTNDTAYLMCRDALGATVTIPAMGQLKCTYVISLVYPA